MAGKKLSSIFKKIILAVIILFTIITFIDFIRIINYSVYQRNPPVEIITEEDKIYFDLVHNKEIDWSRLNPTLEFISHEYDVADFKFVNLLRILYEFPGKIPVEVRDNIDKTLLAFRYWWDEPGENSMCYWSENHQILFASAEYLAGQLYVDKTFSKSGLNGKQHVIKAKRRILDWLEMRWKYGFTEYYSATYYIEDIAALTNLIDFAKDDELTVKCKIILDLLLYDVASQQVNGMFASVSGRAYEHNRKGEAADLGGVTKFLLRNEKIASHGLLNGFMLFRQYDMPHVLRDIANDTGTVIVEQINGLNISELKKEGYYGTGDKSMMMQWGMEAFTNHEVVRNSLKHIRGAAMFSNDFLKPFRYLDFTIIRWLHLEPLLVKIIQPATNGKAIQRAHTYTYRTKDYSLYSVQDHDQQQYADQHHIAGMNMGNHFSVFHTHPARKPGDNNHSPNYWVGYGRLPHVQQFKNVSMAIYAIPPKKNLTEAVLPGYTHAYFPVKKFDSVYIFNNYAFGKKGSVYIALIGKNNFSFRPGTNDDLIQRGRKTFWIMEAGSAVEDTSFQRFIGRIQKNGISFSEENLELVYTSGNKKQRLKFGETRAHATQARFASPYVQMANDQQKIISFQGKSLLLDFYNPKRICSLPQE